MKNTKNLLNKKMNRREFLVYLGLLILTFTGIDGMLKNLKNLSGFSYLDKSSPKSGFGYGFYGGVTKKENI